MTHPRFLNALVRRSAAAAVATILLAPVLVVGAHAGASGTGEAITEPVVPVAAKSVTMRLRAAIRNLPVGSETPRGYERSRFRHWVDAHGDCQDTRDEVLKAESKVKVSGCDVRSGKWFSYYDRATWTRSSDVDIDHLVPLKEAWDSGARRWNADTRKRYANDLSDGRSLVAVTDNVNQSKSDRDPAEWMPRYANCRYVKEWTAVKIRWGLKVNRPEKRELTRVAAGCTNVRITVTKARIVKAAGASGRHRRRGRPPVRLLLPGHRAPDTVRTTRAKTPSTGGTPTPTATGSCVSSTAAESVSLSPVLDWRGRSIVDTRW